MQTNKLLSRFITTGTRLAVLASMLMAAFTSNVTPALAAPRVGSVTVGAQTGTLTTGTGGQVTYLVTVAKGDTFSLTANMSVSGLPAGVTAAFVPASLVWGSFLPAGTTRTSTLTITTTNATPAGATPFTVTAVRNTNPADLASGAGTLTVLAASGNAQTITFGPLVDKTFGDPDFTVSASASSGLPVSFTALGQCTVTVALVHLTGPGSCTITASQPGNGTFTAASPVARTFTILAGGSGFELYAVTGSTTIASQSVNVWGYNFTGAAATQPGGPTITVNEGDVVTIRLHNQLGEQTALLIQGQAMIPDRTGVANGGTKAYTFTASRPGTYLYEAGLLPNAQHQSAMGLYGALVVNSATPGQAYDNVSSAYNSQGVLVLSEIDPALNNLANPATFDMRKYNPKYFLINGKVYPNTDPIPATGGDNVLLRYVNAGIVYHSMAVLGAHQTVIALDGSLLDFSRRYVAETIGPGQTADAIVTAPAATATTNRLAIYDGSLGLHNSNTAGIGGMLTFLTVTGTGSGPDLTTGPATSNIAYAAGTLTATVSDATNGNQNVIAAEYYIDSTSGTANPMTGTFGTPTVNVSASVSITGQHTIYVRGRDSLNNWGAFNSALVSGGDATGPTTSALVLSPVSTNATVNVAVTATGNDSATGNSNIIAAEYFIDPASPVNGSGTAMSVNIAAPIASLSATILAATVNGLSEGTHAISVHSRDAANNWGALVNATLTVDKTGPVISGSVTAAPSPNNGTVPFNASTPAVRVTVTTVSDPIAGGVNSNISAAEAFIDTVGANGTGIPVVATDGVYNSASEAAYSDIPLATIAQLTNGSHTIYVHGKDAAGNWGTTVTTTILIDKTPPTIVSINRVGSTPTSAATVDFLVTFSESVTGVTSSNFALVTTGSPTGAAITSVSGIGATRTVTVTTGSGGGGTFGLNLTSATGITDIATNALPTTGLPFVGQVYTQPSPQLYFSTFGNTNPTGLGGTADDADVYFWDGTSAFSRNIDVTAITNPLPTGANVDGFDRVSATQFYMSFNGGVTVPGIAGTVQDEDIVVRNGTTWSLYFDGSNFGLGGTGGTTSFDLDAISIVGAGGPGNVYFSTDNANVPPGVSGAGDDADIYRWNGGSSYTRVVNASAVGWSTANVDGLVWVDATHVYLSYSADTTTPVIGVVEDEDVVRNNGGTWSVYFNGTARGLTAGNQDIDAFDLP